MEQHYDMTPQREIHTPAESAPKEKKSAAFWVDFEPVSFGGSSKGKSALRGKENKPSKTAAASTSHPPKKSTPTKAHDQVMEVMPSAKLRPVLARPQREFTKKTTTTTKLTVDTKKKAPTTKGTQTTPPSTPAAAPPTVKTRPPNQNSTTTPSSSRPPKSEQQTQATHGYKNFVTQNNGVWADMMNRSFGLGPHAGVCMKVMTSEDF